jgi:hypothetical protein
MLLHQNGGARSQAQNWCNRGATYKPGTLAPRLHIGVEWCKPLPSEPWSQNCSRLFCPTRRNLPDTPLKTSRGPGAPVRKPRQVIHGILQAGTWPLIDASHPSHPNSCIDCRPLWTPSLGATVTRAVGFPGPSCCILSKCADGA